MATLKNVIVNTLYKGLFITAEAPLVFISLRRISCLIYEKPVFDTQHQSQTICYTVFVSFSRVKSKLQSVVFEVAVLRWMNK